MRIGKLMMFSSRKSNMSGFLMMFLNRDVSSSSSNSSSSSSSSSSKAAILGRAMIGTANGESCQLPMIVDSKMSSRATTAAHLTLEAGTRPCIKSGASNGEAAKEGVIHTCPQGRRRDVKAKTVTYQGSRGGARSRSELHFHNTIGRI